MSGGGGDVEIQEGPAVSSSCCMGKYNVNPFGVDLILERLMTYLPYDDLGNCFSVSKFWRKKAFVECSSREAIRFVGPDIRDVEKLYKDLSTNKNMKLVKLYIVKMSLDTQLLQSAYKLLSHFLDSLQIDAEVKPEALFKVLKELPNLSILSTSLLPREVDGQQLNYPLRDPTTYEAYVFENIRCLKLMDPYRNKPYKPGQNLSDVCKTFPNLKILSVCSLITESPAIFKDISFVKLKHLTFRQLKQDNYRTLDKSLDMLSKLSLKLCRLQFEFCSAPELQERGVFRDLIDTNLFRKFVESQRDTLQALDMVQHSTLENEQDGWHRPNICPFPLDLPHLKSLHVQKPFIRNLTPIFNALPSLVEAKFNLPAGYNWKGILPSKIKKAYPNLQVLRVDYMDPSMFGVMSKYFPSLRVLQINMCDHPNKALFNAMPNDNKVSHNMPICGICGTFNIHMSKDFSTNKRSDYVVVERNSRISKALEHWTKIDMLIAGNCEHFEEPCFCFIMDKKIGKRKAYLKSDIETLGFRGMYHWARWEAACFQRLSVALAQPNNWTTWSKLTNDWVFVPFDNYERFQLTDLLLKQAIEDKYTNFYCTH